MPPKSYQLKNERKSGDSWETKPLDASSFSCASVYFGWQWKSVKNKIKCLACSDEHGKVSPDLAIVLISTEHFTNFWHIVLVHGSQKVFPDAAGSHFNNKASQTYCTLPGQHQMTERLSWQLTGEDRGEFSSLTARGGVDQRAKSRVNIGQTINKQANQFRIIGESQFLHDSTNVPSQWTANP